MATKHTGVKKKDECWICQVLLGKKDSYDLCATCRCHFCDIELSLIIVMVLVIDAVFSREVAEVFITSVKKSAADICQKKYLRFVQ